MSLNQSLACLTSAVCKNLLTFAFVPLVSAESHSQHGRPPFVHRDDRTNKAYERLQKKLKDRQGGGVGGQVKDSPPSSPQKSCCCPSAVDIHNGVGVKGLEAEAGNLSHAAIGSTKQAGRGRNGELGGKRCLQLDCYPAFHRLMFVCVSRTVPNLLQRRIRLAAWSNIDYMNYDSSLFTEENVEAPMCY